MKDSQPTRLIDYLRGLDARVTYMPFDFSNPVEPFYATLEVITTELVVGNLQDTVNVGCAGRMDIRLF
ncbi:MAG: hypothetical protein ABH864_05295 [archaeon]